MAKKKKRIIDEAESLQEDIIKQYKKQGLKLDIVDWQLEKERYIFKVKLKGNTREAHIRARAPDVQLNLKLPLFYVNKQDLTLYLIVSKKGVSYDRLPEIMRHKTYLKRSKEMWLPYVVGHDVWGNLVMADIDEFPALFTGTEKATEKVMAAMLSGLLQRGRHAKIHLVLAAQNPIYRHMKVDLSNATARIAFKCAKENFSKSILGEGGAESLSGQGDMLAKFPGHNGLQRVQGVYIKPEEMKKVVQMIKEDPWYSGRQGRKFVIPDSALVPKDVNDKWCMDQCLPCTVIEPKSSGEERLLANVILWAIRQDSLSVNALMNEYHIGWSRAQRKMARLEAKLPRRVIPAEFGDIPDDMLDFLQHNGVTSETVAQALAARNASFGYGR